MQVLTVESVEEFFQAQRRLQAEGYSLSDYNEYFGYEVWQSGAKAVKLQLEA